MSNGTIKALLHDGALAANRAASFMAMASACVEIAPADASAHMASAMRALEDVDYTLAAAVTIKADNDVRMAR